MSAIVASLAGSALTAGYSWWSSKQSAIRLRDSIKPSTDRGLQAIDRQVGADIEFNRRQESIFTREGRILGRDLSNRFSSNITSLKDQTVGASNMMYSASAQDKVRQGTREGATEMGQWEMQSILNRQQRDQNLLQRHYDAFAARNRIIGDAARAGYTTAGIGSGQFADNLLQGDTV